jgi:hypothetical protein
VLDGKALRGIHGEELPGVRLVALYAPEAGLGDRRKRGVRTKEEQAETEEERVQAKQEAELSVAPRLREQVRPLLAGRLVSGDALSCQRGLCRQVRAAGGHYLFAVKGNQPGLLEDVALLFTDPPPGERFLQARTVDKPGGPTGGTSPAGRGRPVRRAPGGGLAGRWAGARGGGAGALAGPSHAAGSPRDPL